MIQARASVEHCVLGIVAGLVGELGGPPAARPSGPDDVLDRNLGIGSLERVELLLRIEKAFGVRLPDTVMAEASTAGPWSAVSSARSAISPSSEPGRRRASLMPPA